MEKYFIEENGKKREASEQEAKSVVKDTSPDKMVVESKDEKGDTTVKVLTRLMG